MTHEFIRRELKRVTEGIRDLKQALEQVKTENTLASTTKSVKEYNEWIVERFKHNISYYEKRKGYLTILLQRPEEQQPNLYDELTNPLISVRHTPRAFLEA
ncbi:hypothetical protein MUB16_04190 [Priestia sp. OVL9]|nr:hypothetical protein [Priestia sp. OVL9]